MHLLAKHWLQNSEDDIKGKREKKWFFFKVADETFGEEAINAHLHKDKAGRESLKIGLLECLVLGDALRHEKLAAGRPHWPVEEKRGLARSWG